MNDDDFKIKVVESLARNETRTEDIHQTVKQLEKLPERISLVEQDQQHLHKAITKLGVELDKHTQADYIAFGAIRKWLGMLTAVLLVTLAGVYGHEKVMGWLSSIFS